MLSRDWPLITSLDSCRSLIGNLRQAADNKAGDTTGISSQLAADTAVLIVGTFTIDLCGKHEWNLQLEGW